MRKSFSVLVLLASFLLPSAAFAHKGKDHHKVMGTVILIDANHIIIKTTHGKKVSVPLSSTTLFMRGENRTSTSNVKGGSRVVIEMSEDGKAEHVRLAASKKSR